MTELEARHRADALAGRLLVLAGAQFRTDHGHLLIDILKN